MVDGQLCGVCEAEACTRHGGTCCRLLNRGTLEGGIYAGYFIILCRAYCAHQKRVSLIGDNKCKKNRTDQYSIL
jgi:hypothetical protein